MLKWIALLLMLIDHFAHTLMSFIPEDIYVVMRSLGRISFPVFVYYVALGLGRTSNLKKYMARLLIFAGLAELAKRIFPFFIDPYLNVIFSLFIYGVFYLLLENRLGKFKVNIFIRVIMILILTFVLPYVEYGYAGFLVFLSLHFINKFAPEKGKSILASILITLSFLPTILMGGPTYQLLAGVAGLFMFNDSYDRRIFSPEIEKWTFYWVYPIQWGIFGILFLYMLN